MANRIVHFELPSENPERSKKFYENVLDWQFQKWDGPDEYWLIKTGDSERGIDGGLMKKNELFQGVTNIVDTDNVDELARKITENGGTMVAPKTPVPGIGWLIYFKDLDGHLVGAMQSDPEAK